MHAKISDRTARGAPTYNAWTGQMVEQSDREEMLDVEAEREARAILAETEAECVADWPSRFPQDRGICCAVNEATDALADALRSFLEA